MTSYVYLIRKTHFVYKIGHSVKPKSRMMGLQTGSPDLLELKKRWKVTDAGKSEAACHRALAPLRLSGEWFHVAEEVAADVIRCVTDPSSKGFCDEFASLAVRHELMSWEGESLAQRGLYTDEQPIRWRFDECKAIWDRLKEIDPVRAAQVFPLHARLDQAKARWRREAA